MLSILRRTVFLSCRRNFSSQALSEFTANVKQSQPCFSIAANNVRILNQPTEFYTLLLDMIQRAERRIFISSLYIGSKEAELIESLNAALKRKPSLQLHMVLDLNRSTRPGTSSTAKILLPLLQSYPDRVHVSFFRSPKLRGIMARLVPPRFNEGWGTWHAKIYGVDDQVMISGANLNKSYFTDRQDRYLHFDKTGPRLAQYCFDFLKTVSTFSFRLTPRVESSLSKHSYEQDGYVIEWPHADVHPHYFHQKAQGAFSDLQVKYRSMSVEDGQVALLPIIQGGQFGIREEETILGSLFQALQRKDDSAKPLVHLTSGYFSLYRPYQDLILACRDVIFRIVAASPKANGFYGSRGISGRIPDAYTLFEQRFMDAVVAAGQQFKALTGGVDLTEWEKEGWTYHAKGLWLSTNATSPPVLTLFGSTNLNSRSAHLDTELSFVMVIPQNDNTEGLRMQLAKEVANIRSNGQPWTGDGRKIPLTTKFLVRIVGGML
ncbi:hypothetical protein C8J56DRAFT_822576 [Mycena floridula]|nr:hypothetical protein C8J56DRAFT_822576 [Mycena floridula]